MLFDAVMSVFIAIMEVIVRALPDVESIDHGIFLEMIRGARLLVDIFPPFATLIRMTLLLVSAQLTIWTIGQVYNIFNWLRGSGSLRLGND